MIDEKKLIKDIKDWQEDIHDNEYDANKFDFIFERIYEIFDEQPKISLENKTSDWFPVSEKEPSKYGVYLVSGHIHRKQKEHIRVAEYFGKFEVANNFVVTAWQPLPKPYKMRGN